LRVTGKGEEEKILGILIFHDLPPFVMLKEVTT